MHPAQRWLTRKVLAGAVVFPLLFALTAMTALTLLPRILPQTGQIAFVSNRTGSRDIYVLDIDTRILRNLTRSPGNDAFPNWSPDGQSIVFTSEQDHFAPLQQVNIYTASIDGRILTRLTTTPDDYWQPTWSADGGQIAYTLGFGNLWVLDVNEGRPRFLNYGFDPAWSPDGRALAFYMDSANTLNSDIYVLDLETGSVRNVTGHPANDWEPVWSPDGLTLAFVSSRDGNAEIYTLDVAALGSMNILMPPQRLTFHPANDTSPGWSPDGTRIVFDSERDGDAEIYIMDRDGGRLERLTYHPASDSNPAWRPRP
jgi:Tol biopolymer transport system component